MEENLKLLRDALIGKDSFAISVQLTKLDQLGLSYEDVIKYMLKRKYLACKDDKDLLKS